MVMHGGGGRQGNVEWEARALEVLNQAGGEIVVVGAGAAFSELRGAG